MLKYLPVTLVFLLLALLTPVFYCHWYIWLALILCYLLLITWGSSNIRSGFFLSAFCHGDRNLRKVAITFDDGPDPVRTPEVLDILDKAGVRAGFFCIGEKIEKYPELASRIHQSGHMLGNHSFSHGNLFSIKPVNKIRKELTETRILIEKVTEEPNLYFRPPYGVTNPKITRALKGLEFRVIGWSIRSFDLSGKSPEKVVERILSKLRNGDIILLHDTSPQIIPLLNLLLPELRKTGREIVRFDEMIGKMEF